MSDKIKVACYRRVSTLSAEQSVSYEAQLEKLNDFVENSEAYELYSFYEDEGISGTKLFDRKNFAIMLRDAGLTVENEIKIIYDERLQKDRKILVFTVHESGAIPKYERILCKDTSRFARNINILTILEELKKVQVYVDFLDLKLTSERDQDMMILSFLINNDAFFSKDLSRKLLDGNRNSQKNGILRANYDLYGYKYIPRGKNKTINNRLEFIPSEAIVIQTIFRLYAGCYNFERDGAVMATCDFKCDNCAKRDLDGVGLRVILKTLKKLGYKTRSGKDFAQMTIKHKLDNEKYAGYINTKKFNHGTVFAKRTYAIPYEDYKKHLKLDTESIQPIISPELFKLCEDKHSERVGDKMGRFIGEHTAYKGKIYCGRCGQVYVHNISHKYQDGPKGYYVCKVKKRQGTSECNAVNVFDWQIDDYVKNMCNSKLNQIICTDNKRLFGKIYSRIVATINRVKNTDTNEVQALRAEIKEKSNTLNVYIEAASLAGAISDDTKEIIKSKNTDIVKLKQSLAMLTTSPIEYIAEIEKLLKICTDILVLLENQKEVYTPDELWQIVEKLTVYGDTLRGGQTPKITLIPTLYITATAQAQLGLDNVITAIPMDKAGIDVSQIVDMSVSALHNLLTDVEKAVVQLQVDYC